MITWDKYEYVNVNIMCEGGGVVCVSEVMVCVRGAKVCGGVSIIYMGLFVFVRVCAHSIICINKRHNITSVQYLLYSCVYPFRCLSVSLGGRR